MQVWSLGWEIPWRRKWQATPIFSSRKIPRTEEPGWLQSIGSQRARYYWSDWTCTHIYRASQVMRANAGDIRDVGLIPGPKDSPGEGHGKPLQYSCLENPMNRGVWQATVHGVAKSQTWLTQLSTHTWSINIFQYIYFQKITGINKTIDCICILLFMPSSLSSISSIKEVVV